MVMEEGGGDEEEVGSGAVGCVLAWLQAWFQRWVVGRLRRAFQCAELV